MLDSLAQSWLTLQCRMLPSVRRGVVVLGNDDGGIVAPSAYWPESTRGTTGLVAAARLAMMRRANVVREARATDAEAGESTLEVACPLLAEGRVLGVIAVELDPIGEQQQRAVLQLLSWGSPWLDLLIRRETSAVTGRLITLVQVMSCGVEHERFLPAATATVTALTRHLGCERVSLGLDDGSRVTLRAMSHASEFDRRASLARDIEAAMDEALDLGRSLVHPAPSESEPSPATHQALAERHGAGTVCTVPLAHGERLVGALTFERSSTQPFDPGTRELCEAVAGLIGPVLHMKYLQDRPVAARLHDALRAGAGALVGRRRLGLKLAGLALAALLGFLSTVDGTLRVSADAALEGHMQRALVAPVAGYIAGADARAGDRVEQGQLLARMDARDLRLERRRAASEREELVKQHRRALASLDGAEGKVLSAQVAQADARLAMLDEQLDRVRITAPFAGVIVSGDLNQSLGAPVERGQVLFELAPLDDHRVVLQVEDSDIAAIRPGQRGTLTLAAMPGDRHAIVVEQVRALATPADGRNAFRVEARIEAPSPYLRPGLIGVAKVDIERQSLLAVWTRELVDWLRLRLWALLP